MAEKSQFRLRILFAYTFVIALGCAYWGAVERWQVSLIFALPLLAWPPLFERAVDAKLSMRLNDFHVAFQYLAVSVFSSVTLMLSAIAFVPHWKGSKGMSWIFYCNDGWAAVVMFPFYMFGAHAFGCALMNGKRACSSPTIIAAIAGNAMISLVYVAYVVVFRFTGTRNNGLFVIVPGAAAVSYLLMTIALVRRFESPESEKKWYQMFGYFGGFIFAMFAKVPLATYAYRHLPDEPPEGCFVVTAATRGHRRFVKTRFNSQLDREINDQLMRFWALEDLLRTRVPKFHRWLRCVYNRVGPKLARQVRFRWQADALYLFLKPFEWAAVIVVRVFRA